MTALAPAFRDRLCAQLEQQNDDDGRLSPFIREFQDLDCTQEQDLPPLPVPGAVTQHLTDTLDGLGCAPDLAEIIRPIAETARWYQLFEGEGIDPTLAAGLVAGQFAGQVGLVAADRMRAGLFLLAPGLHYPLHQHGALELYYVVSDTLTLQYGTASAPFQVPAGAWSVTPSNRVHALTTNEAPCLVIYAWIGEVESPNWWWVKNETGGWDRLCWERRPDAKWVQTRKEPVSAEVLLEAGEPPA